MPILDVQHLSCLYETQTTPVVEDLSFTVESGEIFALVGPSGCGKTTTLRTIAGFERAMTGRIEIDGQCVEEAGNGLCRHDRSSVPPDKRPVGLVFQEMALFPHLTVLDNVTFGLRKLPKKARRQTALEALAMVEMADYAERWPHELSGGQQQRVALARSMAPRPKILLLDEPFNQLDPSLREEVRRELAQLLRQQAMTALLVTHDQEEALALADRVGVMRQGRLCQVGDPFAIYHRPADPFVAQFLGRTNLVEAAVIDGMAQTPFGPIVIEEMVQGRVVLSIRPEHLRLSDPSGAVRTMSGKRGELLKRQEANNDEAERCPACPGGGPEAGHIVGHGCLGTIRQRQFKGHDLTLSVESAGQMYTVQSWYDLPYHVGDEVWMTYVEPAVVVERHGA